MVNFLEKPTTSEALERYLAVILMVPVRRSGRSGTVID